MKDDHVDRLIIDELRKTTEKIALSNELRSRIKAETLGKPRSPLDILKAFLNHTIEVPLIPLLAGVAIVIMIFLPFKTIKSLPGYGRTVIPSEYKTINLGSATIIIDMNKKGDGPHDNY